jgi:electron transfer flavoprotein beta subunit
MVPGLIGEITNIEFVTNCVKLEIDNSRATASREIEGGIEKVSCELPLIIGSQKGLVEESDLKIPNMRGIMQARQKPLEVIEPESFSSQTSTLKYSKPEEKAKIRMINPENLDELVEILHTEEKII